MTSSVTVTVPATNPMGMRRHRYQRTIETAHMVECTLLQRVSLENRDTAQIAKRSISRPDVGLLERLFHMSLHVSEQHIITLNTFFSITCIYSSIISHKSYFYVIIIILNTFKAYNGFSQVTSPRVCSSIQLLARVWQQLVFFLYFQHTRLQKKTSRNSTATVDYLRFVLTFLQLRKTNIHLNLHDYIVFHKVRTKHI